MKEATHSFLNGQLTQLTVAIFVVNSRYLPVRQHLDVKAYANIAVEAP